MDALQKTIAGSVVLLLVLTTFVVTESCFDSSYAAGDASGKCGDDLSWTYDTATGALTITGTGEMDNYAYDDPKWGSNHVKSVSLPAGLTSIGSYAFSGCTGLTSITIPDGVTSIGSYAFRGCTGLDSADIPGSVMTIGDYAFSGCTGLTSITIPDGVVSIGSSAFFGCTGLTSITIPDGVVSIGWRAFFGCTGLTSADIPGSVTYIGGNAFSGCTGLESFAVSDDNTRYSSLDGVLFDENKTVLIQYPASRPGTSYGMPSSVTSIGDYAFFGCTGLTSADIPDGVVSIGYGAFRGCTGLTSADIPDGVVSIGDYAFFGCTGLTSADIPGSVTYIEDYAFFGCTGLTSADIPGSVTYIGGNAFSGCTGLESFAVSDDNTRYSSLDGVLFDENKTVLIQYPASRSGTSYDIPDTVESIGSLSFFGASKLETVNVGKGMTADGLEEKYGFAGCASLRSVTVSSENEGLRSVGGVLFATEGGTDILLVMPADRDAESYTFENDTIISKGSICDNPHLKELVFKKNATVSGFGISGTYNLKQMRFATIPDLAEGSLVLGIDMAKLMSEQNLEELAENPVVCYFDVPEGYEIPETAYTSGDKRFLEVRYGEAPNGSSDNTFMFAAVGAAVLTAAAALTFVLLRKR